MDIVEALEPFGVYLPDGRPLSVASGDLFRVDDPIVKGREHLFGPLVVRTSAVAPVAPPAPPRAVETASAAPGDRRSRSVKPAAAAAREEV